MRYLKCLVTEAAMDSMRITLSAKEDALTADASLPGYPQRVRMSPEPLCDWCGDADPLWTYAASEMSTGEKRQCWRWNACERCSLMIDRGNWDWLERKVAARFKKLLGPKYQRDYGEPPSDAVVMDAVRHSFKQFHDLAVAVIDAQPGGGKTQANTFTGEE